MFTILLLDDGVKRELRVVDFYAIQVLDPVINTRFSIDGFNYYLPPDTTYMDLPRFDDVDAAWKSIREDFCPSLHP